MHRRKLAYRSERLFAPARTQDRSELGSGLPISHARQRVYVYPERIRMDMMGALKRARRKQRDSVPCGRILAT